MARLSTRTTSARVERRFTLVGWLALAGCALAPGALPLERPAPLATTGARVERAAAPLTHRPSPPPHERLQLGHGALGAHDRGLSAGVTNGP
jgi:hypothetical protein